MSDRREEMLQADPFLRSPPPVQFGGRREGRRSPSFPLSSLIYVSSFFTFSFFPPPPSPVQFKTLWRHRGRGKDKGDSFPKPTKAGVPQHATGAWTGKCACREIRIVIIREIPLSPPIKEINKPIVQLQKKSLCIGISVL